MAAIHQTESPFAGQVVRIKDGVSHPQVPEFGGADYHVEDWWDRVGGGSWMDATGNPACLVYAMRTGLSAAAPPIDDDVLYGHIGSFGHLVHTSEVATEPTDD